MGSCSLFVVGSSIVAVVPAAGQASPGDLRSRPVRLRRPSGERGETCGPATGGVRDPCPTTFVVGSSNWAVFPAADLGKTGRPAVWGPAGSETRAQQRCELRSWPETISQRRVVGRVSSAADADCSNRSGPAWTWYRTHREIFSIVRLKPELLLLAPLRGEHEMIAITMSNAETVPNWRIGRAFRNIRQAGRGEKSLKVNRGFSFILTAGEPHQRAKT
jgi:hypothetical protein